MELVVSRADCPHCLRAMVRSPAQQLGRAAWTCERCKGVWTEASLTKTMLSELKLTVDAVKAQLRTHGEDRRLRAPACPSCATAMSPVRAPAGEELDLCRRCGSLWFDKGELFRATVGRFGQKHVDQIVDPTPLDWRDSAPTTSSSAGARFEEPRLGWKAPAAIATVLGLGIFVGLFRHSVEVTVSAVTWDRTVTLGTWQDVRRQVNCDQVPFGEPKRRATTTAGSFVSEEDRLNLCEVNDRVWRQTRIEREAAPLTHREPVWPQFTLAPQENEGSREERYLVEVSTRGALETCQVSADVARSLAGATRARMDQRLITRGLVCGTLAPVK